MKEIQIPHWQCDYCGKIFARKWECELHEKEEHKCPNCKHGYYVYGCELNCSRINNHKKCKFEDKKND